MKPEIAKIKPKFGERAVAKIGLNSLCSEKELSWHKQNFLLNKKNGKIMPLIENIDITNNILLTEDMVQVTYKYKDKFYVDSTEPNSFIAAFTTSHARMVFHEMLDK